MNVTISLVVFVYLAAATLLYVYQRDFLYFPTPVYDHPYDQISIVNEDETLEIIALNQSKTKALIYFGGNAEAVVANAEMFQSTFPGMAIYLVNYRGYSASSGEPSELGIYSDSLKIYDEIKRNHAHISVAGRSLGSGVATYLASQREVQHTVLITPYDSILNIAKSSFPIFPIKFLLRDHFDSLSRASKISSPVMVLAAEFDQVIPAHSTQRLVNGFRPDQVTSKIIANTDHNNISNNTAYYLALSDFLEH